MSGSRLLALGLLLGIVLVGAGIGIGYGIGYAVFYKTCDGQLESPPFAPVASDQVSSTVEPNCENMCGKKNMNDMQDVPYCPTNNPIIDDTKGPFDTLTEDEMKSVRKAMLEQNLITNKTGMPSLNDNYIFGMSLLLPRKDEALGHLEYNSSLPDRMAEVHVHRGNAETPDLMEYSVGPLGSENIKVTPLTPHGSLHFNTRPRDSVENGAIHQALVRELTKLKPLFEESFDGAYFPGGGLDWFPLAPPGLKPEERETKIQMSLEVPGTIHGAKLHAMPFVATLHNPGIDTSTWYIYDLYYINQGPYKTADDLLDAYKDHGIRKVTLPHGYKDTLRNLTLPIQTSPSEREFSDRAAPRTFEPAGPRYTIHGYTVHWMGWELIVSSNMFRGPSIFNVKFKGDRVLYENSMSESALIYAGDSIYDGNAVYLDATFALGMFDDLIKGVDCPQHATYLNTTWWDLRSQEPVTAKGVCVFEADGQEALWRRKDRFMGGLRNNYLIVRYVLTLGNYDYIIDYSFLLDGKMQTKVMSYGYLQAGFWDDQGTYRVDNQPKDPFGHKIGPFTHGPIHDHTFGFKVDLDILGRENSFEAIHWKAGDILTALRTQSPVSRKPPYFLYNETRYLEYEVVKKETGYRVNMEKQTFWTVKNENFRNKWGVERAYRIYPMATGTQIMPDSHPAMKALSFSKYHCIIAAHHDDEKYVTGAYDQNRLSDPQVSLENIIDGEDVRNSDIVAWLSVAFLHVPTSENIPQVTREETGFWLKPFNFFDSNAVYDMPQWVNYNGATQRPPVAPPCVEKPVEDCYFCS